jgi:hypothetical protein
VRLLTDDVICQTRLDAAIVELDALKVDNLVVCMMLEFPNLIRDREP